MGQGLTAWVYVHAGDPLEPSLKLLGQFLPGQVIDLHIGLGLQAAVPVTQTD